MVVILMKMLVKAGVHVLHIPLAIGCGGGLVNVLGSRLPCWIKYLSLFFNQT